MKVSAIAVLVFTHDGRSPRSRPAKPGRPAGAAANHQAHHYPIAIAEALAELELYAPDVPGVDDMLELVRAILDEQDGGDST